MWETTKFIYSFLHNNIVVLIWNSYFYVAVCSTIVLSILIALNTKNPQDDHERKEMLEIFGFIGVVGLISPVVFIIFFWLLPVMSFPLLSFIIAFYVKKYQETRVYRCLSRKTKNTLRENGFI